MREGYQEVKNINELINKATTIVIGKTVGEQQINEVKDEESGTLLYRRAFTPIKI